MSLPLRALALAVATLAAQPGTAFGQSYFDTVGVVSSASVDTAEPPPPLPGLDSALSSLLRSRDEPGHLAGLSVVDRRVQVEIQLQRSKRADARLALDRVVEVTKEHSGGTVLQAWVAIDDLASAAAIDGVGQIRRPARARALGQPGAGSVRSEGSPFFAVGAWHAAGFRGGGVSVGIIDIGFKGYEDLLGRELPAVVAARNFVDGKAQSDLGSTIEHGTAVAEIVHDVAPDAVLALARIDTPADFLDAVRWLVEEQGVDVISTSIGFFNQTSGDGTGFFADVVQTAVDDGVFWATAAGNSRESHWGGTFVDYDGDDRHDFELGDINYAGSGDGDAFFIHPNFTFWVFLRWDDWTDVDEDFDLILYRWDGEQWRMQSEGGRDPQNGGEGQRPTEAASVRTNGEATAYGFQIRRIRGADRPVNFEVLTLLEISETESAPVPLNERLAMRSLLGLADSPAAMTVGAINAVSPFVQEEFSSEGPTNGPGGREFGGIFKPDIAAYDGVSTASYGQRAFFGTSAATPHVAGAAALVLSAHPSWSPAQIYNFLADRAGDLGEPGRDNRFGHGRLRLGVPPIPTATLTHTRVATPTITRTPTITKTPTITPTPTDTPTPGRCYGDCNGNGIVEISEIVVGVRISLGLDSVSRCPANDHDANAAVAVNELIRAIRAALFRCSKAA